MAPLSNFHPESPTATTVAAILLLTFSAVFFLIIGMSTYVKARLAVKRRVSLQDKHDNIDKKSRTGNFDSSSLLETSAILGDVERAISRDESEKSKIRRELQRAGIFSEKAVFLYQVLRLFLIPGAALGGYLLHTYFYPDSPGQGQLLAILAGAAAGLLVPSRFVEMRKKRIVRQCRESFPDFIDLMIVCAEAGMSSRAAIDKLSREIAKASPILGAHLYLASLEIRAGGSLYQALFGLAKRTKVDEAATLATLLQQTEQLGTSITDSLRVYRDEMRERRLVAAEEKAHSLPAKLVVPMGIFVFPVIIVVIILPAIMRIRGGL
jgi:tight adherence protein C